MGESDRYQDYKTAKRKFTLGQPGNALFSLFAINLVAFFLILLVRVFFLSTHQGQNNSDIDVLEWFAIPANLTRLSERPWTIITFMFAQGGTQPLALLLTMVGSMLWLYAFGYMLQSLSGNRYILPIYIYGSLLGALFYLIVANAVPYLRQNNNSLFLYGAQTGTMAMAVAVTTLSPQYKIFKHIGSGIPVWVLTGLYILFNLINTFPYNAAKGFSVIGAVLAGYLFVIMLRKGKDLSQWMHNFYNWCGNLFTPDKSKKQNQTKEKYFYNTGNRNAFTKNSNVTQQRIDEVLDKISQKGYHFLTEEEKNILKRASEEDI
jgi:membrane associated rhomboid family serine protease